MDDGSDPKQGVLIASRLMTEKVTMVVGNVNSGVSIPASDVYAEGGVVQVAIGTTSPLYTERGLWNTFRMAGRDDQQAHVAVRYIIQNYPKSKIAIVHDKSTYGKGLADGAQEGLLNAKKIPVFYEAINPGEKDYSALVSKLKAANVDLVYYGGLPAEAGLIRRQIGEQGLEALMIGGDGLVSNDFMAIAGKAGFGTLMTFSTDPRTQPEATKVVADFRTRGIEPDSYTLYGYAAVQVLKQAAEAADSFEGPKIAAILHSGRSFNTVLGPVNFNEKGDSMAIQYIIYGWREEDSGKLIYFPIAD
jgi:branched-chain amino acid transport system substrate-binding protein